MASSFSVLSITTRFAMEDELAIETIFFHLDLFSGETRVIGKIKTIAGCLDLFAT